MQIKNKELHRITSTAIIRKDGKYLIVKRSPDKKSFPGLWTVPGGGLETADYINTPKTTSEHWYFAIENSLRREIREEVNLEVEKLKYLLDIAFILPNGTPAIILSYYCDYKSGEIKLSEENTDYKWVTYEEAKKYDLIEGILGEIKMVDKILRTPTPNPSQERNKLTIIKIHS